MTFEEAKERAESNAKKYGKIIMEIQENNDYWFFDAGLPNKQFFDNGAGSIYINKKDGTVTLWSLEVQELNANFKKNSKTIYYYEDEQQ